MSNFVMGDKSRISKMPKGVIVIETTSKARATLNKLFAIWKIDFSAFVNKIQSVIKEEIAKISIDNYDAYIKVETSNGETFFLAYLTDETDEERIEIVNKERGTLYIIDINSSKVYEEFSENFGNLSLSTCIDDESEHIRITIDGEENIDINIAGNDDESFHEKVRRGINAFDAESVADVVKWLFEVIGRVPKCVTVLLTNNYDDKEETLEIVSKHADSYCFLFDDYYYFIDSKGNWVYEVEGLAVDFKAAENITKIQRNPKVDIDHREIIPNVKTFIPEMGKRLRAVEDVIMSFKYQ